MLYPCSTSIISLCDSYYLYDLALPTVNNVVLLMWEMTNECLKVNSELKLSHHVTMHFWKFHQREKIPTRIFFLQKDSKRPRLCKKAEWLELFEVKKLLTLILAKAQSGKIFLKIWCSAVGVIRMKIARNDRVFSIFNSSWKRIIQDLRLRQIYSEMN